MVVFMPDVVHRVATADAEGGDAEVEAEAAAAEAADPDLLRLVNFCSLKQKSLMVQEMICAPCLEEAQPTCVNGSCSKCSFKHAAR